MPFRSVIIDNDGVNRGLQAHRDLKGQSVETQSGQSRFFPVFSGETGDMYLGKKNPTKKNTISTSLNLFLSQVLLQHSTIAEKLEFCKCTPT